MSLLGKVKAIKAGSVVVPQDVSVFQKDTGQLLINDLDGYIPRNVRCLAMQDPRIKHAISDGYVDAYGTASLLSAVSDSGVNGADTIPRFAKVADPLDATRSAFMLRITQNDTTSLGLKRVELGQYGGFLLQRDQPLWLGMAFLTPSSWKNSEPVLVGNVNSPADETVIWQIHDIGDPGDEVGMNPSVGMKVVGGGAGKPQNAVQTLDIATNPNPITLKADNVRRVVFSETDYPADVWQYWIFQIKLHWDATHSPYFRAWRRVGYTGPWVKVIDDALPNQYNNIQNDYQKHGIYYYANAWTAGIVERVLYSKGLYSFRDDGTIKLADVQAFLSAI